MVVAGAHPAAAQRIYYALESEAWDAFTQPIRELCGLATVVAEEAASTTS